MSCVFDSSSIFEALIRKRIRCLSGNLTISLARYELGNVIWKRGMLSKDLKTDAQAKLLALARDGLKLMKVIDIEGQEEGVLNVAEELKIAFYDASYVYAAKARGVPLVTEDKGLRERAKCKVKTVSLDQLGHINCRDVQ
ncbi:MAG: toxin VapC [Candidatus Methanosuratincola subterraneus]|uniref:PIN domain-containing protein n=2 Tax=Candidatus Methanosuratincola (ex Vanwonterghem et al. 2016) TaxID=1915412 RepID=A0A7J3UYK5_9CREN|nr:MAG: toxin VapC [Candidatus Methanosuratincola subterraneus]